MRKSSVAVVGFMTSILLAGCATAAIAANSPPAKPETASAKATDKDFGRLSRDGVSAFSDVQQARMAIFDGKVDEAAKLVADAKDSIEKAKSDDTVFMKAESAFHAPANAPPHPQTEPEKASTPQAWIPIDGDVMLDETFQSTPEKAAAIVAARKNLQEGNGAKALQTIKLASVDVDYALALAPLESSIVEIDDANRLMTAHDYYGASQALRQAEDGLRYDEIDDVGNVKGQSKTSMNLGGK
jgi:hypothetical protein